MTDQSAASASLPTADPGQGGAHAPDRALRRRARLRGITPVTVLVTLASLAGAQLLESNVEKPSYDTHRVGLNQPAAVSATQDVVVTQVVASGLVAQTQHVLTTAGVFVGVDITLRTHAERLVGLTNCTLETNGKSYPPVLMDEDSMPNPGFQTKQRLVFELSPDDIRSPYLLCKPYQLLGWYSDAARVDLGVDADAVRRMAAATSQGMTVARSSTTEVIPG